MVLGTTLNCPLQTLTDNPTMTRELALSLLRQGNDGDSILQILETIAAPEDGTAEPTAEEIQF